VTRMQPLIPRFYCDWVNWLIQLGRMAASDITISGLAMATGSTVIEMFDNKPHNLQTITASGLSTQGIIKINTNISTNSVNEASFISILGHNINQADAKFKVQVSDDADFGAGNVVNPALTEVMNIGGSDVAADAGTNPTDGNYATPASNGWSLFTFTLTAGDNQYIRIVFDDVSSDNYDADIKIGTIQFGKYIDPPTRPNIDLPLDLEFKGNLDETDGGQSFSNMQYNSAPDWFLAPYEISANVTPSLIVRSGRYLQNWTWSMLPDTSLIPADLQTSTNLLTGDTMWNILQYTQGRHFPCLIQLDNTSTNEWLWARILKDAPAISSSPNVYTINWPIREEF
jgi:hypothetical protein